MSIGVEAEKERKILVAVDEGEESMYALRWCLTNVISPNSKDTLILLHAQAPRAAYTALDGTGIISHLFRGQARKEICLGLITIEPLVFDEITNKKGVYFNCFHSV